MSMRVLTITCLLVLPLLLMLGATATAKDKGVHSLTVSNSGNTQGLTDKLTITKFGDATPHDILVDIDAKMPAPSKAIKIRDAVNDYRHNGVKQFNAAIAAEDSKTVLITDTNGNNVKKIVFKNLSEQKWDTATIGGAIPPTNDQIIGATTVTGPIAGLNPDGQPAVFKVGAKVGALERSVTLDTDDYATVGAMLDAAVASLQAQGIDASRDGNSIKVTLTNNADYFGAGCDDRGLEEELSAENIDTD